MLVREHSLVIFHYLFVQTVIILSLNQIIKNYKSMLGSANIGGKKQIDEKFDNLCQSASSMGDLVKYFSQCLFVCFTKGVSNEEFLKLRDDVFADSILLINVVLPSCEKGFKKSLTFFQAFKSLTKEEFLKHAKECFKNAKDALLIFDFCQKMMKESFSVSIQRKNAVEDLKKKLDMDKKQKEDEIKVHEMLAEEWKGSANDKLWFLIIPCIGSIIAACEIKRCMENVKNELNEALTEKEKLAQISDVIHVIDSGLIPFVITYMKALEYFVETFKTIIFEAELFYESLVASGGSEEENNNFDLYFQIAKGQADNLRISISNCVGKIAVFEIYVELAEKMKGKKNYIEEWKDIQTFNNQSVKKNDNILFISLKKLFENLPEIIRTLLGLK